MASVNPSLMCSVCNGEMIRKLVYLVNYDEGREEKIIEKIYGNEIGNR